MRQGLSSLLQKHQNRFVFRLKAKVLTLSTNEMIKIGATDLKMNEAWVLLTIRFQPTG